MLVELGMQGRSVRPEIVAQAEDDDADPHLGQPFSGSTRVHVEVPGGHHS